MKKYEYIFKFESKIVFIRAQICLGWHHGCSEVENTGATRLVAASATTVIPPPPFVIKYSNHYTVVLIDCWGISSFGELFYGVY